MLQCFSDYDAPEPTSKRTWSRSTLQIHTIHIHKTTHPHHQLMFSSYLFHRQIKRSPRRILMWVTGSFSIFQLSLSSSQSRSGSFTTRGWSRNFGTSRPCNNLYFYSIFDFTHSYRTDVIKWNLHDTFFWYSEFQANFRVLGEHNGPCTTDSRCCHSRSGRHVRCDRKLHHGHSSFQIQVSFFTFLSEMSLFSLGNSVLRATIWSQWIALAMDSTTSASSSSSLTCSDSSNRASWRVSSSTSPLCSVLSVVLAGCWPSE